MSRLNLLLIAALAAGCLSCSGQGIQSGSAISSRQELTSTSTAPAGLRLPGLGELKLGSEIESLSVFEPIASAGASPGLNGLALSPEAVENKQLPATAFAVYGIPIEPETVAITVRLTSDYKTPNIIALGDWGTKRWDFSLGKYFGTVTIILDDLPDGRERWLSEAGVLYLGVIMHGSSGTNTITSIVKIKPGEVSNLAASTNRYDGIKLTWENPEDLEGVRIERRLADSGLPWEQMTAEPLDYLSTEFIDLTPTPPQSWEYRVSTALRVTTTTGSKLCWSPGTSTTGQRSGILVDGDISSPLSYVPANLYKYMSFFVQPEHQPSELEAVQSQTYPPQNGWSVLGEQNGIGPFELDGEEGMGLPFNLRQSTQTNTEFTTLGFSRQDGIYVQVVTATEAGAIDVMDPLKITAANNHFFGFVGLPRTLGALYWDAGQQRLEMLQSWDELGLEWRTESETPSSWLQVGSNLPEGPIYIDSKVAEPHICYRDANSGNLVVKMLDNGWEDIAPAGVSGFRPELRHVNSAAFFPGKALFWIPSTLDGVSMMIQDINGVWMQETLVNHNAVELGETGFVSEFDVYTDGAPSTENYIVFIQGGHVYMLHSGNPMLSTWSEPILIDGTGFASNLKLIVVGSAEDFSFKLFATYLIDNGQGVRQISFRDIIQLKHEALD